MDDIFERAHELRARGEPFAIATVVAVERPASARPGMKAIILADGTMEGWVGGSCAEPVVAREAQDLLREGVPRLIRLSPEPGPPREGVVHRPMTCHSGGALEIYIEPVLPKPRLLLIGEAPVVRTLAAMGQVQGFAVETTDPSGLDRDAPPALDRLTAGITSRTYVVVATMGTRDEEILERVARTDAAYVGLVASRRRAAAVSGYLRSRGVPQERVETINAPAGLDIGAVTQEEIAASIMAEIIQVRRSRAHRPAETPPAAVAADPVCGMIVEVAAARHASEYRGARVYFCSAHCRDTFDRDPERYAVAVATR